MQFYDEVKIAVQSGKWWDGIATGRRESGVPHWWPAGGDGGKWGSVIFQASKDENTLLPFRFRKIFKANYWFPGRRKDQYWANADDLTLKVPVGTAVKDHNWDIMHIFAKDWEERTVVKWWDWWLGNIHFKDSVHQYPNFYLCWEPGHEKEVTLELQLLADVALIGTPSVGKSSIINAISHTKAKVAEYPFTTLIPNLGSVQVKDITFNMIDIPGLIKGAAEWKWLGNAFLRHVLKAKIFCFVSDCARYEEWVKEVTDLLEEVFQYIDQKFDNPDIEIIKDKDMITLLAKRNDEIILEKRLIFVINKYDLINDMEIINEELKLLWDSVIKFLKVDKLAKIWTWITPALLEKNTYVVSAATRYWLDDRLNKMIPLLKNTKDEDVYHIPSDEISKDEDEDFMMIKNISDEKDTLIEEWYIEENDAKYNEIREIKDPEFCKLVWMLPRWNDEAEWRFWKTLWEKWIYQILEEKWIKKWDVLKIKNYYAGKDDRYILF